MDVGNGGQLHWPLPYAASAESLALTLSGHRAVTVTADPIRVLINVDESRPTPANTAGTDLEGQLRLFVLGAVVNRGWGDMGKWRSGLSDDPGIDDDATAILPAFGEATAAPRRRGRRVLAVLGAVVLLLLAVVAGGIFALSEQLGGNVDRLPGVFVGLDEAARPPATEALTFLLVGTDTRSGTPTTGTDAGAEGLGGDRSDVLMLARIDPSRTTASVVSIPRDSWVEIPGHGRDKINAAYSFGGPSLLIETVENLTDLRIDHFAVIDFAGFEAMVDAVGGIDVGISAPTSDAGVEFHQGVNHLDGAKALTFVRQRHGLPDGDLDRAQRQQAALRALLAKVASSGMLTDPAGLYRLLDATTRSVGVDDTLTNGGLRSLAFEMRGLRPHDVRFLRAPMAGLGREGAQSVVYLDPVRTQELWAALRAGRTSSYTDRYPSDSLGSVTR